MKYLYRATFTDGTTFEQPADDSSRLMPGVKSSKYDFLEHCKGRTIDRFDLYGDGKAFSVFHRFGPPTFAVGTCKQTADSICTNVLGIGVGDPLPEGCEWVEGDPHQGVYFRHHTHQFNGDRTETGHRIRFCIGVKHEPGVKNFLAVE